MLAFDCFTKSAEEPVFTRKLTECEQWSNRDLSSKQYVHVWADGIHAKIRLEEDANKKQCLLVLMGATADGQKELIAVLDAYRESEQSWSELLLDLKQRGLTTESIELLLVMEHWGFGHRSARYFLRLASRVAGSVRQPTF